MSEKFERFLKSIHIEDSSRFDMDFDYAGWEDKAHKVFAMAIAKNTPWEYDLLDEFKMGLGEITYEYDIKFSYKQHPNINDAVKLFEPWYASNFHCKNPSTILIENNAITIAYKTIEDEEKEKKKVNEFRQFLKWLNYSFPVVERLLADVNVKEDDDPFFDRFHITKQEPSKAPTFEPNEDDKEEAADENNDNSFWDELSESEKEEIAKEESKTKEEEALIQFQNEFIKQAEENLALMEAERRRKKIYRHGEYVPVDDIETLLNCEHEYVDFDGFVFETNYRVNRKGKANLTFSVHDDKAAIPCRAGTSKTLDESTLKKVKAGQHYRIRGAFYYDEYAKQKQVQVHFLDLLPPKKLREDLEPEKRVELHLHTKMSAMDGVGDVDEYFAVAKNMGMKAIAITDHGCVQAFPAAQNAAEKTGVKAIYGCELYMFDLNSKYVYNPANISLKTAKYCIFDLETTGLSVRYDRITEFGAIFIDNGREVDSADILINPEMEIPENVVKKTHITNEMVKNCPTIEEVMGKIEEMIEGCILVSHNATFDVGFLNETRKRMGLPPFTNPVIDTLPLSRYLFPSAKAHRLGDLSKNLGLETYDEEKAHRADADARFLYAVWGEIRNILWKQEKQGLNLTHADLANLKSTDTNIYKHLRTSHVIAIAKDKQGLMDLYRLVTDSNLSYLAQVPKIPRSEIEQYRSHLLIGSACANGEIFDIARTRSEEVLIEAMKFYDYIEIQPLANYSYLVNEASLTQTELERVVKDIYIAAKKAGKMVVATGDVHYVNPEDKIIRDVFIQALAIGKGRHPLNPFYRENLPHYENPDQHLRSTREMLDAFSWLSEEEAKEIVITNTNAIADMCEPLIIVDPHKTYAPNANLPDSANELKELVYKNLHRTYGENPPQELEDRLKMELDGIINNGYSVTYMIAYHIIQKAKNEPEHYIVGSRGSVGSSFVATMADITEVNPLAPHYLCPKCHHFEWGKDSHPEVKSGFDLPNKNCPGCGTKMIHDGQNIPFQTFLGFHAEKVPDIDLNFPPDYQSKAHAYMRTLMGENNVFRAGTIEKVAVKTAFGYVRGYYEKLNGDPEAVNKTWQAYVASRCEGVKRTTGQHPGGIVVIPSDHDKFEFTPIQYPADDVNADWLTTHFDFRSMHDELLKIDLLGHIDPLATRLMSLYTGVDLMSIPMDDPKVLSLFDSADALKLERNYLNAKTGTLGLPEFGTSLAQSMLMTTHPKCFNDLLIISGLAHGTEVWTGNAEKLILEGVTDLSGVIGCRDDIMSFLISKGVPSDHAFKIMEKVRKGKGLSDDEEAMMREKGVPDYYINSCKKIQYLFPRAHATAYVMMACRVGYFKIYYPLDYYAVFFSVRCDDWDIETMVKGEEAIISKLEEYKRRVANDRNASKEEKIKPKDTSLNKTLTVALEMVERGYKFEKIDINKSDATLFIVDHEHKSLIPPFKILGGLGESVANSIVEARKQNPFLSKEDIKNRTRISQTTLKELERLGAMDGMPETNQYDLFAEFF